MAMSMSTVVKLQTSDGQVVEVPLRIAKSFGTLKVMFDTLGDEEYQNKDREQGPDDIIPLHHVESDILEIIIKWATYHKDEMSSLEDDEDGKVKGPKSLENINVWDKTFIDSLNLSTLQRLLGATHYLDCKGLYQLCCKAFVIKIQGKAPEEMRKMLNLPDDFTPEEKEQIKKENQMLGAKKTADSEEGRKKNKNQKQVKTKKEKRMEEEKKKAKEDKKTKKEEKLKRGNEETEETKKEENEDNKDKDKKEEKQQEEEQHLEEKPENGDDKEKETEEGNGFFGIGRII